MLKAKKKKEQFPTQTQTRQPGLEYKMNPKPEFEGKDNSGSGRICNKVALITGGDSGIGRAVAAAFAKDGCSSAIVYYNEHKDATLDSLFITGQIYIQMEAR